MNDNLISENTLSLLGRVFSPFHSKLVDDLLEEMPEEPPRESVNEANRIQANRPILKLKKPKLDIKDLTSKIEQGVSALNDLTLATMIVHSNRSFNTENDEQIVFEEAGTLGVNYDELQ